MEDIFQIRCYTWQNTSHSNVNPPAVCAKYMLSRSLYHASQIWTSLLPLISMERMRITVVLTIFHRLAVHRLQGLKKLCASPVRIAVLLQPIEGSLLWFLVVWFIVSPHLLVARSKHHDVEFIVWNKEKFHQILVSCKDYLCYFALTTLTLLYWSC